MIEALTCGFPGAGEAPGRPRSELDLATSEEIDRIEMTEGQQAFDNYISLLEKQWQWSSEHEAKFVNFRNRRLAHLEVCKDEDLYGPTEIQKLEWDIAVEAVGRLITIAQLLSAILGNPGRDFAQSERLAAGCTRFLADLIEENYSPDKVGPGMSPSLVALQCGIRRAWFRRRYRLRHEWELERGPSSGSAGIHRTVISNFFDPAPDLRKLECPYAQRLFRYDRL